MDINPKQRVIIIGCGYTGQRVAQRCLDAGADVSGIVRTDDGAEKLQRLGITVQQIDFDQPLPAQRLELDDALVFYCMPPPSSGTHDDPRMAAFIQCLSKTQQRPQAIVYLSTTGVYGDCRGAWVTESNLPAPLSPPGGRKPSEKVL